MARYSETSCNFENAKGYGKTKSTPQQNFIPLLDPGHGGINPKTELYVTGGKRSPRWSDGSIYYEGVGNRDISKRVCRMLDEINWVYEEIVDHDNWRDVPLEKRTKIENELSKKHKTFYFSIHSNGFGKKKAHGTEVWTSPGFTGRSDKGASIFMHEFVKEFPWIEVRKDVSDGDVDKESNLWVLKHTRGSAFLIESMFHTNERECRVLMTEEGREKIAKALFNTILRINKELY